jgi:nicotinate-nucleotide adenylyltransferase
LAIQNEGDIALSDFEIKGPEPSYTINTVKHFIEINPDGLQVYWLVGVDSISELSHWYRIEELIEICNLSIMYRGGFGEPDLSVLRGFLRDDHIKKLTSNVIRTPLCEISSTEIRRRISQGEDVSGMLASEVADYIKQRGLYL